MGIKRDMKIEDFQKQAGIKPATGDRLALLRQIQEEAFQLIRVIELETSGIRDGDGYWGGSDGMGGTLEDMKRLIEAYFVGEQVRRYKPDSVTVNLADLPF